jgi:glycine betaine transporter
VFFPTNFDSATRTMLGFVVQNLSWLYLIMGIFFLVFVIALAFSRYGSIKLGKEDDEPEFDRFSWVAMLFQAGMGLAIVFWGVSEPVLHYAVDPPLDEAQPNTPAAAQLAMQYSFFHWGLTAWAVFAVTGLAVAYFNYRRDMPGLISPLFYPLLGDRVNGPLGKAIDVLALLITLLGVAVSLGQGGLQIGAGFDQTFGFSNVLSFQLLIIGVTTVAYLLSASTPIEKGVRWLSNVSMIVGGLLALYFLFVGPTVTQLNAFTQGIGDYLGEIIPMSFTMNAFNQDTPFLEKFTLFYWGWWVTWAPYVGVFAARISRGRTVREFVLGMLIVPSVINIAWFAIVGASAIDLDRTLGGAVSAAAQSDPAVGLFAFLQYYPLPILTALVAIFLLWIFFVAGADAATIVLGSMSVGGVTDPRRFIRLAWGVIIAAFAAVLLSVGGLEALQRAAILAGLPFGILMLFMCWALYRALRKDAREQGRSEESQETEESRGQSVTSPSE